MKTTHHLVATFILAFLTVSVATVRGQFIYETNNGTITITEYAGPGGDVTIPSEINGLPVTSIGGYFYWSWQWDDYVYDGAFQGSSVTSITIPNSVTSIGRWAFLGCSGLTNVVFGNSITNIGSGAFGNCTSLSSISIPNSVTSIGRWAFGACTSLSSISIPNSVTTIGDYAFHYCTNLASITIPNSVTTIGEGAFQGCTSLISVTIPKNVISIGDWAFSTCPSLTRIEVDPVNPSYSSLDGVVFNKSQTTLVEYPGGKGRSYSIPDSVTSIGNGAFATCGNLTNVTIPNGVTSIGDSAFHSCWRLTSVTIPNSVATIWDDAFWGCRALTNVTICNGVTRVGNYAFANCTSLTSVTIPNSVTNIGRAAFSDCTTLQGAYFQGNAPITDWWYLFKGATNVTAYYLPGTAGWGDTFAERPTAPWQLPYPVILTTNPSFGIQTNNFGFRISWATNLSVVVETSTSVANPSWSPISTNALTKGWFYFTDPQWTNYPARFYRVRQW